jgi:two-component sensor histidine kinase
LKNQLNVAASRVAVLGQLYDQLAHTDHQETDARSYFEKLAGAVLAAVEKPGTAVSIEIDAPAVALPSALAADLGLITNELLTNACKYGRNADGLATVKLCFSMEQQTARLSVEDKGRGLPQDFSLDDTQSLGLKLVRAIASSHGGKVTFATGPGTRFDVHIPV